MTVEYRIVAKDREAFLAALQRLARERRRDGAYAWGVFETLPNREDSWKRSMWNHGWSIYVSTKG